MCIEKNDRDYILRQYIEMDVSEIGADHRFYLGLEEKTLDEETLDFCKIRLAIISEAFRIRTARELETMRRQQPARQPS